MIIKISSIERCGVEYINYLGEILERGKVIFMIDYENDEMVIFPRDNEINAIKKFLKYMLGNYNAVVKLY